MAALRENIVGQSERGTADKRLDDPSSWLQEVLRRNRRSGKGGTYAVCSAHPAVIEAAIQQSLTDNSFLHVESTSSQVNQFGGYTGQTPMQFAQWVQSTAKNVGLPSDRILLGGDHLGPFPWRAESSKSALEKGRKLVRDCVAAGYQKIHLDASMACADDAKTGIGEQTIAERAAILCQTAEEATANCHQARPHLFMSSELRSLRRAGSRTRRERSPLPKPTTFIAPWKYSARHLWNSAWRRHGRE